MSEQEAAPVTVAETPATEQVVAPEAQTEAQQAGTEVEAVPVVENKAKERLSLRFSELTSQREAAKEEAQRHAQEAQYWREQALSRQQAYEPEGAHDEGYDPNDPQSFYAAVDRAVEARFQRETQAQEAKSMNERVQSMRTTLLESGLDGAALIASGAEIPFTLAMFEAISVSEQPAQLADHLGRNPDEAKRIASLTDARQGVELARLEARLASQPRTTNAPAPPNTVGGRAIASSDPTNMTFEQYKAARESGRI